MTCRRAGSDYSAPDDADAVLRALRSVRRATANPTETELHRDVGAALAAGGVVAEHEARVGRCRPDFLTAGGTVVEIKKGRPPATETLAQLVRYAALAPVRVIVLVAERGLPWVPDEIGGKPVVQVPLYASWGIAI